MALYLNIYLSDLHFVKAKSTCSLCSNNELILSPPADDEDSSYTGDRVFVGITRPPPKIGNMLPNYLRSVSDLPRSKEHLKTFLFREVFTSYIFT